MSCQDRGSLVSMYRIASRVLENARPDCVRKLDHSRAEQRGDETRREESLEQLHSSITILDIDEYVCLFSSSLWSGSPSLCSKVVALSGLARADRGRHTFLARTWGGKGRIEGGESDG